MTTNKPTVPNYSDDVKVSLASLALASPADFAKKAAILPDDVRAEVENMVANRACSESFGKFDADFGAENRNPNTAVSVHETLFNAAENFVAVVKQSTEQRGGGNKKKWQATLDTPVGKMTVVVKPYEEKK